MKQIRKRLTYANVMSSIAVFFVIGGASAFAAAQLGKNTVGTKQLKKNAVNSAKVKDRSLKAVDFKKGQLPTGARGATGPKGDPGLQGAKGDTGPRGPSNAYYKFNNVTGTNSKSLSMNVPAGNYVVSASMYAITPEASTGFGAVSCNLDSTANTLTQSGVTTRTIFDAPTGSSFNYDRVAAETPMAIDSGGGAITWSCSRFDGTGDVQLYQVRIIAIQVETLTGA